MSDAVHPIDNATGYCARCRSVACVAVPNPALVDAGARALCRPDVYNVSYATAEKMAGWVLAAVEPLIRADEREQIAVWPNTRAFIEHEVRAQIAADIESVRQSHQNCPHPECAQAYGDAARIARGESNG